jgi:hypothetical protein
MTSFPVSSRQPSRTPWTRERLVHERAVALGCAIEPGTASSYSSALQSYLAFCKSHNFPIDPTPDTLSFFVVFMCHHIKPKSVESYLSGICNQLEPFFPIVRESRRNRLVIRTLQGCKKLRVFNIIRKRPLTRDELCKISIFYSTSTVYDDKLFLVLLLTGFHALLRLGELVWPDKVELQDYRKVILRNSVELLPKGFAFLLPGHKADRFFEGNRIILQQNLTLDDPHLPFINYLVSRDLLFPFNPELWLRSNGQIPTRSWFVHRLHHHFANDVGGHSLRSGGATALAEAGVAPHIIQAIGRWASNAFQIYIRQHPVLLAAMLYGHQSV